MARGRHRRLAGVACLLAAAVGAAPRGALAQGSSDKAAAEALFEQGQALIAEGKIPEACTKFELSQRLDAGLGTLLYLADCYEQTGRYASAWATFKEAAAGARAAGQADREALARSLADALVPKLSQLTIRVAREAEVPGLEVRRDGQPVPAGLWGVPVPVDAGTRKIEATAPGKRPWTSEYVVKGPGASELVVPPLEDAPVTAAPSPAPVATAVPPASPGADRPAPSGGGSTQRTLGWVLGGVGLAALGAGGFFVLQAKSKDAEADDECGSDGFCTKRGVQLGEDALGAANLATYLSVGGAIAVAGGLTLVLTAPSDPAPSAARGPLRVATRVTGAGAFVTVDQPW